MFYAPLVDGEAGQNCNFHSMSSFLHKILNIIAKVVAMN
jgi:hypothetical protein